MRYQIFAGSRHYPDGGAHDYHSASSNLETAKNTAEQLIGATFETENTVFDEESGALTVDWSHVFDTENSAVIAVFGADSLTPNYKNTWQKSK